MDSSNSLKKMNDKFLMASRVEFLATYRQNQAWSLPDSVIYYISKNPSTPKCYQKLIQSCKYFFLKNPILIVRQLTNELYEKEWYTSLNSKFVDLRNVTSKLWITDEIVVKNMSKNKSDQFFSDFVVPKIYQCDAARLTFCDVTVMNKDATVVELEKIIQILSFVKLFRYDFDDNASKMVNPNTVKELLKISHFPNIPHFTLSVIPESFDIDGFYDYIKKNKRTNIVLDFCNSLSVPFKIRLQSIVNEIIATKNHNYKIPLIHFPESDQNAANKLWSLYYYQKSIF